MAEKPKEEQDLLFQNVELHSLGRKEYGSLQLTRHHFLFRYYPGTKRGEVSVSGTQNGLAKGNSGLKVSSLSTESSAVTEASASSPSLGASDEAHGCGDASKSGIVNKETLPAHSSTTENRTDSRKKQRPVEMWVAYPLINHCVLRPSHSPSQPVRFQGTETHVNATGEDDELFPPTFGTSDYERPSSDSTRLAPYASSPRSASPAPRGDKEGASSLDNGRQPAIRLRLKDFRMMALHFHSTQQGASPDDAARQVFYSLRNRSCVESIEDLHAFYFSPPKEEIAANTIEYDGRREYARMGISSKAADGPGSAWRISDINRDYSYSATYPSVLCVPRTVSDNMLKYGGAFRSRSRIPCLSYLHSNGGSITRSSQPMVGVQNRRNPQDERLVSAIFSSHTTPSQSPGSSLLLTSPSNASLESSTTDPATLGTDAPGLPISQSDTALDEASEEKPSTVRKRVYGSTRRNLIVDARPKINVLANRATGGGIEDVANYRGNGDMPVEKVFLNVANIHVMRASLEKVVESFANSDYIKMKPDQEALRKSGWLGHIASVLDGTEMIARVVGLGGSHVLVHCSDGWDRTAQISGLAQVMLDPFCRTLNGFISLVQKEFLSFGHKFKDRNGIEGSEKWFEIENERVVPSRSRENNSSDPTTFNALGAKALTGAKNWFEKNRGSIFRHQNSSQDSVNEQARSRPPSPPPNPLIHSSPSSTGKEEKGPRLSEKEVSPVFHQFLDTVYQLLYQNPDAFEFNERFLRRLFYHAYSCQYGEFLFNSEKERCQNKRKVGSVWSHFLSRRQQFTNPNFVPKIDDPLLFPNRFGSDREVEVRWWNDLFGRSDEEMNVPRTLARTDATAVTANLTTAVSFDECTTIAIEDEHATSVPNGSIKETKSTPNLRALEEDLPDSMSLLRVETKKPNTENAIESTTHTQDAGFEVVEKHPDLSLEQPNTVEIVAETANQQNQVALEYDGDPLGVMASMSKKTDRAGLDFAAFASQTAFRDR